ncbi:MAG: phospholipase D-like domain-containing protein [Bacteriovoracaceae bacterium]
MVFLRRLIVWSVILIPVSLTAAPEVSCYNILDKLLSGKALPPTTVNQAIAIATAKETANTLQAVDLEADEIAEAFFVSRSGNMNDGEFKLVVNPKEALASRILMIRQATDTIDLSYYIFKDSEASRIILGELHHALGRGVNVRIMVDGSGSALSNLNNFAEIQTLMKVKGGLRPDGLRATFEPVVINPLVNVRANLKRWMNMVRRMAGAEEVADEHFSILQRSHDKILLIDRNLPEKSMAMLGGRNISNDYFGLASSNGHTYNDLDIILKGVSREKKENGVIVIDNAIADQYDRLYNFAANKRFNSFYMKIGRSKAADVLNRIRVTRNTYAGGASDIQLLVQKMGQEKYLDADFDKGDISILNEFENISRPSPLSQKGNLYAKNPDSIIRTLWAQIGFAKKDILIGSPYLYFTDEETSWLISWLKADSSRTLRIMTSSTAASDNLPAQAMMEHFMIPNFLKKLQASGIAEKQYELLAYGNMNHVNVGGAEAQGALHGKFWMVDNRVIGVGSSNFDPISRRTNSEIMANVLSIDGTATADSLNHFYTDLRSRSVRWGSKEFNAVKASPMMRNRIRAQAVLAKIMKTLKLLPE